jgi:hypothetical protein
LVTPAKRNPTVIKPAITQLMVVFDIAILFLVI